jgi:hypothetical protein
MTGTRFYSDSATSANPLAYAYGLSVTANTEFITAAGLNGKNASNIIYIRRLPCVLKITFKAALAGKLTIRLYDGTTNSDYELSDNGADYTANIQQERYITVPRAGGSPANFLRITSLKWSSTTTLDISIIELDGA